MPLSVIYCLTKFDDIILNSFLGYSKISSTNLCKPIHDIINHSTSICPFESGMCGKEEEELQKLEHVENQKSWLDFEGLHLVKK